MRSQTALGLALFGGALVLLLAGKGAFMTPTSGEKPPADAKDAEAIAKFLAAEGKPLDPKAVAPLLGVPGLTSHPNLGPLRTYRCSLGQFWVSRRANVVFYEAAGLKPARSPLPENESESIARAFLARHVQDFAARNFVIGSSRRSGTKMTHEWTEAAKPPQVSIFPNWMEVTVGLPERAVLRFSGSDLRFVRTRPPALDEAAAKKKILGLFDRAAIEEIRLMELPIEGGSKAITVYTAILMVMGESGPVTESSTIEADSGEVVP